MIEHFFPHTSHVRLLSSSLSTCFSRVFLVLPLKLHNLDWFFLLLPFIFLFSPPLGRSLFLIVSALFDLLDYTLPLTFSSPPFTFSITNFCSCLVRSLSRDFSVRFVNLEVSFNGSFGLFFLILEGNNLFFKINNFPCHRFNFVFC